MSTGSSRRRSSLYWLLFFGLSLTVAWADPALPYLISDHAVFQQRREIRIWGTADPAEQITVKLQETTRSTHADPSGHWSVVLPPMKPGGPFTLTVLGKKTLVIKDLMIGEVWVASGQSNMTFALSGSTGSAEEMPKADYPDIRLFTVPKRVSLSSQPNTLAASWHPCTPDSAKEFSAVAYYFARDLHRKLNVPIGVIESAWPGTAIEEWLPPVAAQQDPQIKPMLDEWNSHDGKGATGKSQAFDLEFDDFELLPDPANSAKPAKFADFDDGSTRNALGGYFSYNFYDAPETSFELAAPGHGGHGYAARVAGQLDASSDSRLTVRFQTDRSPADLSAYSGIRFWVRGNGQFRLRTLQPTIADWDDYSSAQLPVSPDWTQVTIWFRDLRQDGWGVTQDFTAMSLTGLAIESVPASGYPSRPATGLFQGMIAPLVGYPFRGAIWYQGESNAWRPSEYRRLLADLIESWRVVSHQPDMQFLIVQLPNHGAVPEQPSESAWAEVREAQFLTAKQVPGTGLAVTIDVGDPKDVHPHRKMEVGERLAEWALGTTYQQAVEPSGPLYHSMTIEGNEVHLHFDHVGVGLVAQGGTELLGFAVAGTDHKFHWADAHIVGDSVVVSSRDVPSPVAARYAWGDSPRCNLFNKDGLPASPFRTDDWPGTKGTQ